MSPPLSTLERCFDLRVLEKGTLSLHALFDSGVNVQAVGERWQCVR